MESYVKYAKNSLMLNMIVYRDKRLGKLQKARFIPAVIYSLLERTMNTSINNINKYFSKKYGSVYVVNQMRTLEKRSGFKKTAISRALKLLDKYDYIHSHYNRVRHVNFIFMPKVTDHCLTDKGLDRFNQARSLNDTGTFGKRTYHVRKTNVPRSLNELRCNDHIPSDQSYSDQTVCNKDDKNKKRKNRSLISWSKNTVKNIGTPKSVNDLIAKNSKTSTDASNIIREIISIKNNINRKYTGVYYSDYFKNESNPFIQDGSLLKSLKNIFKNHKDLKETITTDYQDYIDDNSTLKLRTSGESSNTFDTNEIDNKIMKKWKYDNAHTQRDPELINKISKKWEDKSDHTIIRDKNGNVKINKPLPDWAKDGYKLKLHPTSLAKQRKVKKQLYDLDHPNASKPSTPKPKDKSKKSDNASDKSNSVDSRKFAKFFDTTESDLKKNLVTYYENQTEINKQEATNPGVNLIFDPNTKFNGRSVKELQREMDMSRGQINTLESKLTNDRIKMITDDAKTEANKDIKAETVPPTDDKKSGTYDEDNAPF